MWLSINAMQSSTNLLDCVTMHELQEAMSQDQHLQCLMEYVIQEWPESKNKLLQDIRPYWTFRDDMAVIRGSHQRKTFSNTRSITTAGT